MLCSPCQCALTHCALLCLLPLGCHCALNHLAQCISAQPASNSLNSQHGQRAKPTLHCSVFINETRRHAVSSRMHCASRLTWTPPNASVVVRKIWNRKFTSTCNTLICTLARNCSISCLTHSLTTNSLPGYELTAWV